MLEEMHNGLDWRHRALEVRVRNSTALQMFLGDYLKRSLWVDREVQRFRSIAEPALR